MGFQFGVGSDGKKGKRGGEPQKLGIKLQWERERERKVEEEEEEEEALAEEESG